MKRIFLIVVLVVFCKHAQADQLYVRPGGYNSIQSAINDANNGDVIVVNPEIYYENINFFGKAITVSSVDPNDSDIVATTIIDGSEPNDPNIASVITFANGEGPNSVITGFTIQNGFGQNDTTVNWRPLFYEKNGDGGGVLCRQSSPTIRRNIFKSCTANYGGGAVFCHNGASPTIEHNIFLNNYAGWYGGTIFCRTNCSPKISNNIFRENQCKYLGGAIYLCENSYSEITNNWFEKNNCERLHGGAIYYFVNCSPVIACNFFINNTCTGPDNNGATGAAILIEAGTAGKIINNLFTGNYCTNQNGVVIKVGNGASDLIANNIIYNNDDVAIYGADEASPTIKNNNVWQNTGGNYGGSISDQNGINGNISADPQVGPILPQPFTWHELHPNSPCIDTGDNNNLPMWLTVDYDETDRIVNSLVDIGPQEYHAIAVPKDYNTIQAAIDNASEGDEIVILAGFYEENLDFFSKNIRLRSFDPLDSNCVAQTIIDGNNQDSCIKITSGQDSSTAVAGFTIQDGDGVFGGGVLVSNSVGPIVMYNYISGNKAIKPQGHTTGGYGGGIDYRWDANGTVMNNTIINNYASAAGGGVHLGPRSNCSIINNKIINNITEGEAGGGIYCYDKTTAWIVDNEIIGNEAQTANGGGIWLWESQGGIIEGNVIIDNIATPSPQGSEGRGGGIGLFYKACTLTQNNIICGNKAKEGGGIWVQSEVVNSKVINNTIIGNIADQKGAGIGIADSVYCPIINNIVVYNGNGGGIYVAPYPYPPSEPNIIANNIWNNQGSNYSGDINDLAGINSNISADPCFVNTGYWADNNTPDTNDDYWVIGDCHISYFSACRDTGSSISTPNEDFERNPRPYFLDFDIGAYELQCRDLTATGTVDFTDLLLIIDYWLQQGPSMPADLDQSEFVDFRDFALLTEGWMK